MVTALKNYFHRIQTIGDNPFWATQRSRAQRTGWLKTLWRGYAGFALLIMLPLGFVALNLIDHGCHWRPELAGWLCAAGVLQLIYLGIKASLATAPSVVQARQQGTLLALALTRINSADFADGVALSESKNLLREFLVWTPALALVTVISGQGLYGTLMLTLISVLVVVYFSYSGVLISATSKDSQEAGRRASQGAFIGLAGSCLGFVCGGFMLGPLWILHPVFAYICSLYGAGTTYGMTMNQDLAPMFWYGWSLLVIPVYLWLVLNVRQLAIRALERVRIA